MPFVFFKNIYKYIFIIYIECGLPASIRDIWVEGNPLVEESGGDDELEDTLLLALPNLEKINGKLLEDLDESDDQAEDVNARQATDDDRIE